ncbi:lipid II-degrading bacteriocin [Pseudomonas syringae]|uniref:lipid II-degrading bacteriocin n=1 Tax=Pseudomonas syringae TaxID=317 RepID=UPI001480C485|nr:lipid II-degrading bacteriocin [Pseudomonas syringae]
MSNTITLPPLHINAVRDAFAPPPTGLTPPMPSPAIIMVAQHRMRMKMYGDGFWREMLIKHMEEMNKALKNGWRLMPTAGFLFDSKKIPLADKYMCINPNALSATAVQEAINGWGYGKSMADAREISGGILSPMAAFGHFFNGGGAQVITNINNLSLNLSQSKIPALEAAFTAAIIGSSPISISKAPYNTSDSFWITGAWLGNITLKIEGVLDKFHDGRLSFAGSARAYNDTFDFNASMHRSGFAEELTRVGRLLGESMSSQPYEIAIQGELPFSIHR